MKECLLTSLKKLHGVNDGMVSVYAEGHQDVGRGIEQDNLRQEAEDTCDFRWER